MTPEIISSMAGIVLMLLFAYVPGLNTWYAAKDENYKKLFMLALLVLVAGGAFALACAGILADLFGLALSCDRPGLLGMVRALIFAIMANQSSYKLAPKTKAVRAIIEASG